MGRFLGLEKVDSEIREIKGIGVIIAARFALFPMKIEAYQFDCALLGRESALDGLDTTFQQRSKKTLFEWQEYFILIETKNLIYGKPLRYNEMFYSKGIGRTWSLPFNRMSSNGNTSDSFDHRE